MNFKSILKHGKYLELETIINNCDPQKILKAVLHLEFNIKQWHIKLLQVIAERYDCQGPIWSLVRNKSVAIKDIVNMSTYFVGQCIQFHKNIELLLQLEQNKINQYVASIILPIELLIPYLNTSLFLYNVVKFPLDLYALETSIAHLNLRKLFRYGLINLNTFPHSNLLHRIIFAKNNQYMLIYCSNDHLNAMYSEIITLITYEPVKHTRNNYYADSDSDVENYISKRCSKIARDIKKILKFRKIII